MAILEPDRYEREVTVFRGKVRRGHAWDEFEADAAASGKVIATETEDRNCQAMAGAVRTHRAARAYLDGLKGLTEHTLTWTHAATGLKCKSRLDWLDIDADVIVDLKTARDASEMDFGRTAARYRYHTRAAFYADAYRTRYGKPPTFVLVVVEKEPPFAVAVYRVSDAALAAGRRDYERLLTTLATCRKTGTWPGIAGDAVCDLVLPEWVYSDGAFDDGFFETEGVANV